MSEHRPIHNGYELYKHLVENYPFTKNEREHVDWDLLRELCCKYWPEFDFKRNEEDPTGCEDLFGWIMEICTSETSIVPEDKPIVPKNNGGINQNHYS